ncbi:MAG: hypothetical protein R2765_04535 [Ferruginibacter sp.]
MIQFHEIKVGDYLIVDNDGDKKQGEVTNLELGSKQVCVDNGVGILVRSRDNLARYR